MIILGLNHGEINSSAVIVEDGKIIAGAPEERFSRQKKTKAFPQQAINFCLEYANIQMQDVDFIAQGWNPGATWHKFEPLLSSVRLRREDYFYTIPDNLFNLTERAPKDWILMSFPDDSSIPPIYYIQHHRTHSANAFFMSPFEEAAILTCDWRGENECLTWGTGQADKISIIAKKNMPHSLGMFYATYTELLGYRRDNDEWKVMALSAFDVNCDDYLKKIRSTVNLLDNGHFELDQSYYQGAIHEQPKLYTQKLVDLLGGKEGIKGEEDEWSYSVAKAMQMVFEEILIHSLVNLYKRTKCKNLVFAGGCAMNSVMNGKILENTPFEHLFISYAPDDLGNSIGAALYVAHCLRNEKRDYSFKPSYLGPEFSNQEIREALERRGIKYQKMKSSAKTVSELLSKNEVVAYFNGRMEFGERALGNRSILADPRDPSMKDKINSMIKYRESYRPFAPSVIQEKTSTYFDTPDGYECPYMEKVAQVKKEYQELLPAITHIDGSGRLQTVNKEHNKEFYNIINEFEKITDFPIVLNTSFNINGEPIVLSPDDALNTFYNSGLRYLAIGDYLVEK